jgi:hypothetical protein
MARILFFLQKNCCIWVRKRTYKGSGFDTAKMNSKSNRMRIHIQEKKWKEVLYKKKDNLNGWVAREQF